jgi:hypothetical protein
MVDGSLSTIEETFGLTLSLLNSMKEEKLPLLQFLTLLVMQK